MSNSSLLIIPLVSIHIHYIFIQIGRIQFLVKIVWIDNVFIWAKWIPSWYEIKSKKTCVDDCCHLHTNKDQIQKNFRSYAIRKSCNNKTTFHAKHIPPPTHQTCVNLRVSASYKICCRIWHTVSLYSSTATNILNSNYDK